MDAIFEVLVNGKHKATQKSCELVFLVIAPENAKEKQLLAAIQKDYDIGGVECNIIVFKKTTNRVACLSSKFIMEPPKLVDKLSLFC